MLGSLARPQPWRPRPGPELVASQARAQLKRAPSRGAADTAPGAHRPQVFGLAQPAATPAAEEREGTKGPSASRDTGHRDTEGGSHPQGVGSAHLAAPPAAFLRLGLVSHPQGLGPCWEPVTLGPGDRPGPVSALWVTDTDN